MTIKPASGIKPTLNSSENASNGKEEYYRRYMERVGGESIPAYEPELGSDEIRNITDAINSNWISEGKFVRQFEQELSQACERKYALSFCNATAALITGMKSLGIGAGDEVAVPSLAHSADPNSISLTGATPVFSDVDEKTLCLTANLVDAIKTRKTKAVLFISLYGNAGDLAGVEAYCRANKLILINDCAPALFGKYNGRPIASYGDFSVLSFFADKTITTGEGGMLLTDEADLLNEANIFKHDGRRERGYDVIERIGYNFRITELQAAVGVAQLEKKDRLIQRKKDIYNRYKDLFDSIDWIELFEFNGNDGVVPHRNIIFVPAAKEMIEYLSRHGIGARSLFMPMHSQPCYNSKVYLPVTDKLYKTGVCLPSAPSLTNQQIEYIVDIISKFHRG